MGELKTRDIKKENKIFYKSFKNLISFYFFHIFFIIYLRKNNLIFSKKYSINIEKIIINLE
jgi:hypothetical protein